MLVSLALLVLRITVKQFQKVADFALADQRMAQRLIRHDFIPVTAPFFFPENVAFINQFRQNSMSCPFGNPDGSSQVTQPNIRISRYAKQHVSMVCQKVPAVRWARAWLFPAFFS